MRAAWAVLLAASAAMADPVPVVVPSGQPVSLSEILLDDGPGALWARFRFLAPDIAPGEDVLGDAEHLCAQIALPYLDHNTIDAARIVISFADRPVAFGTRDPWATQVFEVFRPDKGACIWEGF